MALFGKRNANAPAKGTLEYFEAQSRSARSTWFVVLALTLLNTVLTLFTQSNSIYLLSAWAPLDLIVGGMYLLASGMDAYVTLWAIAAVILMLMLLAAIFWKKSVVWPILAAVLYALDTAYMLYALPVAADTASLYLFHLLALALVAVGAFNAIKANKARKAQVPQETVPQFMNETNNRGPEL